MNNRNTMKRGAKLEVVRVTPREAILSTSGKKISELTDEEVRVDLPDKLLEICEFVGVSQIPSDENLDNLATMVRLNYPNLSLEKIALAFTLACAGRLNVEVKVYGTFGAPLLGAVLNAYVSFELNIMRQNEKALPAHEYTTEEYDEMGYNVLDKYVEENKGFPVAYLYKPLFRHIVNKGLFSMTQEEYKALNSRVMDRYTLRNIGRPFNRELFDSEVTEEIVKEHFRQKYKLDEKGVDTNRIADSEKENQEIGDSKRIRRKPAHVATKIE